MQILEFLKAFYHCGIGPILLILPITQNLLMNFFLIFLRDMDISLATNHIILVLIQITVLVKELFINTVGWVSVNNCARSADSVKVCTC